MRLFSNFDTKKMDKTFKHYQKEFGKENVLLIQKSKLYGFIYIFGPLFGYLLIETVILYLLFSYFQDQNLLYIMVGLSIIIFLLPLFPVFYSFIAYKMDFLIITPRDIIKYNQEGIFERDVKTLNSNNLKTISIQTHGVLKSIFNSGDITFLSESGEQGGHGEIRFTYIYQPTRTREKIEKIVRGR